MHDLVIRGGTVVDGTGALQAYEGRGGQGVRSRTLWAPPASSADTVATA